MIVEGLSLARLDAIYQRMGIKELVVIPWLEDGAVVGVITGYIDVYEQFPGSKSAFLEHFIVLPSAKNKLQVMQQMPKLAATLLAGKVERILLCIAHADTRRDSLGVWARRAGYTKFGEMDSFDWYIKPLTGVTHGKETPEDAGSGSSDSTAAAAPGP